MAEWQSRPLDPVYPVIFIDAVNVKIRDRSCPCRAGRSATADDHARTPTGPLAGLPLPHQGELLRRQTQIRRTQFTIFAKVLRAL